MMNQLQAVALNEGLRCKKRLWREKGRQQLESLPLAPWATRRRGDLLELLDRLNPIIAELTQAIEQEVEKHPEARRLMTHPGVGALTALAFVLVIGTAERFQCGKQIASYLGLVPAEDSSGERRRLGISVNKAVPCCVSSWWKQRRSQYGSFRSGGVSSSTWLCDEDERSPR